jgi:hypothetical protein
MPRVREELQDEGTKSQDPDSRPSAAKLQVAFSLGVVVEEGVEKRSELLVASAPVNPKVSQPTHAESAVVPSKQKDAQV